MIALSLYIYIHTQAVAILALNIHFVLQTSSIEGFFGGCVLLACMFLSLANALSAFKAASPRAETQTQRPLPLGNKQAYVKHNVPSM